MAEKQGACSDAHDGPRCSPKEEEASRNSRLRGTLAALREFLAGCFLEPGYSIIRKEGYDLDDQFMLLCFGEALGLPLPTSYYTLELLPYLADELKGWERRMLQRRSVLDQKAGQYQYCC